ncbi:DUF1385 domain-containing protein [Candidatus Woesearchaeota archaeon]|nr:DUF1385 domain-containing protein [Candidatus Woesearchaeota archaeon]
MQGKIEVGGQAVIEGVMMRSPNYVAVSARTDRGIVTKRERLRKKKAFFKWPFVRGVVGLFEMLVIGMKALTWSANQAGDEDEQMSTMDIVLVFVFSFLFVVVGFIVAPFYVTKLIVGSSGVLFNLVDGLIRVGVFVVYLLVISMMKDVKTVFQYHGAEHKAVNCYEAGLKLNVKNCQKYKTLHPRCGTSFIVIVLVVSILVFSLITGSVVVRLMSRILLLPVIAGLSFEFLKFAGKHHKNIIVRLLNYPGMLIQKVTTKEPDDKQVEVAIKSLKEVLRLEKGKSI